MKGLQNEQSQNKIYFNANSSSVSRLKLLFKQNMSYIYVLQVMSVMSAIWGTQV